MAPPASHFPGLDDLGFLRLIQLADSTLPVGGLAHSFGLETLAAEEMVQPDTAERFLRDYLQEAGALESSFCRAAWRLGCADNRGFARENWVQLNHRLSAWKPARESRAGSAALGRRLLALVSELDERPWLEEALDAAKAAGADVHYSTAFGLAGGALRIGEAPTALAYLHHSLAGLVSACQRLMPLGQTEASRILWNLKPAILDTFRRSENPPAEASCFTALLDVAAMRHPGLSTRLFIS